jgi:hypothetical protein
MGQHIRRAARGRPVRGRRWWRPLLLAGITLVPGALPAQAPTRADSLEGELRRVRFQLDSLGRVAAELRAPQRDMDRAVTELATVRPTAPADSLRLTADRRLLDSLAAVIRSLQARMDSLSRAGGVVAPPAGPPPQPPSAQVGHAGLYMNIGFSGLADFGWSSEPDVGSLQRGDHDPAVRGFTIPNEEITLEGAVDPYFKGFVDIVYKLQPDGESHFELEEAYFLTSSLPWNLQVKFGQSYTEFGRQNQQHPHAWAWVDQPLVLNRMFGPDGLRGPGARISWLVPTRWYAETMVTVLNSTGETTFSFRSEESSEIHGGVPMERATDGPLDLLIVPRVATSVDLTATHTLLVGASAAFGPNNSGPDASTQIYGADLYWKWKSATAAAGFPFVSWQAEALLRRYDAAERLSAADPAATLPEERLTDRGVYGQLLWGIKPRLVVGLRGEYVSSSRAAFDSELRADRYRVSPNVTWYPTEFSKARLQYNYDHRTGVGSDHSLWMQFEFILGAHAAHKF